MTDTLRVSLAPARSQNLGELAPAPPLCDPAGAALILGAAPGPDGLAQPLVAGADTMFGPRGACLAAADGPLFVCDTGHHRLLMWRRRPTEERQPADLQIGQPDLVSEGRNGRGPVGAATLNVPTGVACDGDVLAVADAWNHRVLLWHGLPARAGQPADVVLGQESFADGQANRGRDLPAADTLCWPYGVALRDGRLLVADSGNRRALVWERVPTASGTAADLVLGQLDFDGRDENAGGPAGGMSMRWPHGLALRGELLCVADAGNNRIMVWHGLPRANGAPCAAVVGQGDARGVDHNRGAYLPTAASLNMPYAVTFQGERLVTADTANSRLLGYALLATGAAADRLAGQPRFIDKGDNRWGPAARDSLCWPYGVSAIGSTLVVADAGNNRVLLWEAT